MTLKFSRLLEVVRYVCMQNYMKLSAALHELSWSQAFLPYLTLVINPVTLTFDP